MMIETDEQRENREWREIYERRKKKVLNRPEYFEKYKGMWNYRLSFHASDRALMRSVPQDGSFYRCSYWHNSFLPTKFMGSVVLPAKTELGARLQSGQISDKAGSPLITRISTKEIDPRYIGRGLSDQASMLEALRSTGNDADSFFAFFTIHMMMDFLNMKRKKARDLFLGSIVLHIHMMDDPVQVAEEILAMIPIGDAYFKIESLGLFVERYCRNCLGPRYTSLRMRRELKMFRFSLSQCQFCFDMCIQDEDFKGWVEWGSPKESFQERYRITNDYEHSRNQRRSHKARIARSHRGNMFSERRTVR